MTDGRTPRFGVERFDLHGTPGVAIRGEVDLSVVPHLVHALDGAIRDTWGSFVVDLCAADFLDSSGLSALLRARALLGRDERELVVVCPPGPVRRLFEMVGIDDLLILYDSREEAAAALVP